MITLIVGRGMVLALSGAAIGLVAALGTDGSMLRIAARIDSTYDMGLPALRRTRLMGFHPG